MRKLVILAVIGFVVGVCLPVSSATAIQRDIPIPDASFDDHVLAEFDWVSITGGAYTGPWKSHATDAWIDYLYWTNNGWPEDLSAHTGNNKAYADSDYIYQILDETFIEDGTYTFKVWVGQPWVGDPVGWQLFLTTEDYTNEVIEVTGNAGVTWGQVSLVYTAAAADAGKQVGIKMRCVGDVAFEDVTLSYDGPAGNGRAMNPVPADGSRALPSGPEGDGYYMLMSFLPGYDATTHTAYFSSDFDDVNDRNPAVNLGSPPYPGVPGYETAYYAGFNDPGVPEFAHTPLERGATYYWAVDESNGTTTYPGHVWSYTIASDSAWAPSPSDGEELVVGDPSLTLSWLGGDITNPDDYVISYNVYWSIDKAAVEAGSSDTANVSDPTHIIGPLSAETEHYWKVDMVLTEKVPPNAETIIGGAVWQFTTGPEGAGRIVREVWEGIPGKAVSDLTSDPRYPGSPDSSELLSLFEGPSEFAEDYGSRLHGLLIVAQSGLYKFWIATDDNGELWLSTNERPGNAVLVSWVGDFAGTGWAGPRDFDDGDVVPSELIYLEGGKKYYISGLMKEGDGGDNIAVAWQGPDSGGVREVIPGKHLMPYIQITAEGPKPANGATDVSRTPTLEWSPGVYAAAVDGSVIYYSEDRDLVANRTAPNEPVSGSSFPLPLTLDLGETFYWAVDTVNDSNEWPGDVWSFSARAWISVDDMEPYVIWSNTVGPHIFVAWEDGPGNCLGTGNETGSALTEQNIDPALVLGGNQSMQYDYDNDGTVYSPCTSDEVENREKYSRIESQIIDLPSGIDSDWTIEGVEALVINFRGQLGNDIKPMWVQLQDDSKSYGNKVTYGDYADENPEDMNDTAWHEWNIDLADFGVDLTRIVSIVIGIGEEDGTGGDGSGTMYFDDIRLYTPRCIPSRISEAFGKANFAPANKPDCAVNHNELEVMADEWLAELTIPGTGNLVGWWKLDDGSGAVAMDSSGGGNVGTLTNMSPDSDWIAGQVGGALHFDGMDDYVDCGNNASVQITGTAITVSAWMKLDVPDDYSTIAMKTTSGDWGDGYGLYTMGNSVNFYVTYYENTAVKTLLPDGQWHHVVGTYDGSSVRIWADGVEGKAFNYSSPISNTGHSLEIGRGSDDAYNFAGALDDVRLYNAALTDSEVLGLFGLRSDLHEDMKIDFKDFALLGEKFLDEEMFP